MEVRTKAGFLFTCLGIMFFGLGVYLLIGTSFFFLGNGVIASGINLFTIIDISALLSKNKLSANAGLSQYKKDTYSKNSSSSVFI